MGLTPLIPECENKLRFRLSSSKAEGETKRATETIHVLALDNRAIREERKGLVGSLLYGKGITPDDLQPPDDVLLSILVTDLEQPGEIHLLAH